ncbi:SRPBCC family protein [soil metagenome]
MPDAPIQSGTEFVISRFFAASPARLWEAWTDPVQMVQWLGPKGTTGTTLVADVRPGGVLHWRMDGADGATMWGRAVYREVIAPARLVYIQSFSDAAGGITRAPFFDGRWPIEMLTVVTFAAEASGTRVTLTWTPLDAAADEQANFVSNIPSMHGGWGNSFDQLAALIDAA